MKKWRNKITGEINEFIVHKRIEDSEDGNPVYAPFDGHIDDWEDYEEPAYYYFIQDDGQIGCDAVEPYNHKPKVEEHKSIGNYFETKEEAEKAVEKLKAWKRLKDKGFKVDLWDYDGGNYQERIETGRILFRVKDYEENDKDLDLLFGGEE